MIWLQQVIQLFNKPFPENESSVVFYRHIAFSGLFVALFLFIFQPFGFQNTLYVKLIVAIGYGFVTFFAGSFFYLSLGVLIRKYIIKQRLTLGKWIFQTTCIILTISLANFLFARLLEGGIEWKFLPQMILATFAIGVFPVGITGAISMLRQEKKYIHIAEEINEKHTQGKSAQLKEKEQFIFGIPLSRIRYVEALQNYAKIVYLNEQGQLKEQVERTTLKNILKEVDNQVIVRCHRSYLVNQNIILSTSGNAQGLVLTIAGSTQKVPVSRSYVATFRD